MHIDIALRFKPFSHEPGTICLIPGTQWRVQAFPSKLQFFGPNEEKIEHFFSHRGPQKGFTIQQDLERKELRIFGQPDLNCSIIGNEVWENKKKVLVLPFQSLAVHEVERLSMGVHKAQDWQGIRSRLDLKEILPFWFRLGQITPREFPKVKKGSLEFLEKCKTFFENKQKISLEETLKLLFLAGFGRMFNPRLHDVDCQGILNETVSEDPKASLALLGEGAELIRQLFFRQKGSKWFILSLLLPHFHSGRITHIKTGEKDLLDLEWSNGNLRRMTIQSKSDHEIEVVWPKEITSYRVRCGARDRGKTLKSQDLLSLKKEQSYYLDHFRK